MDDVIKASSSQCGQLPVANHTTTPPCLLQTDTGPIEDIQFNQAQLTMGFFVVLCNKKATTTSNWQKKALLLSIECWGAMAALLWQPELMLFLIHVMDDGCPTHAVGENLLVLHVCHGLLNTNHPKWNLPSLQQSGSAQLR